MEAMRVGLIGTGYMGKAHALAWNAVAPVFADVPRPALAVLCDVPEEKAAVRSAELGFARATASWRELVEGRDVDVISITTPNHLHAGIAIAALEAGKHVWCEKPMATSLADARRMRDAARASGRIAILGYNYIQSPAMRLVARLVADGVIGEIHHVRCEMDEDFLADPAQPFSWKCEAASGHGALDDFMVHPLSLLSRMVGQPASVLGEMARPFPERRDAARGGPRAVETCDTAMALLRYGSGATGAILASRAAWGRKGRIALQLFGARGSIAFDQERMNEVALYLAEGSAETRGFRMILAGPEHPPYGAFCPAPGHGLGFNDLKVIECRELLRAIAGEPALVVDFEAGLAIERAVDAIAKSAGEGRWVAIADDARAA